MVVNHSVCRNNRLEVLAKAGDSIQAIQHVSIHHRVIRWDRKTHVLSSRLAKDNGCYYAGYRAAFPTISLSLTYRGDDATPPDWRSKLKLAHTVLTSWRELGAQAASVVGPVRLNPIIPARQIEMAPGVTQMEYTRDGWDDDRWSQDTIEGTLSAMNMDVEDVQSDPEEEPQPGMLNSHMPLSLHHLTRLLLSFSHLDASHQPSHNRISPFSSSSTQPMSQLCNCKHYTRPRT